MITSEFTDKDGFKLQFDENCTEADKKYCREHYPKVDLVANQRLHCTTCDIHIGTAPISEKIIRTHQVLGVTQCNKCFAFYNSGEFGKGEDGSEYYCRWCGQGGEVFCCSSCPFVFCNKCIRANLSNTYVKQIEETDDWNCFVCDKNILAKHRGQHWALRNFMNKQLEKIQKINVTSEDDLNNLLNEDVSICCPRRKRKSIVKPVPAPVKRPSVNGGYMTIQPPAKKPNIQPPTKAPVRVPILNTYRPGPAHSKTGQPAKKNDEIVCTPDILGLFNDNEETAIPSINMMPSTSLAPPPLVMRNNQRPPRPTVPTATPIYHNVNGFQIDLNHAARQEIFRLPNGKLIQVRKQSGPPNPSGSFRPGMPVAPMPRGPQFTIRQANPSNARIYPGRTGPQVRQRFNSQPQTRFTFADGRVVAQPPNPTPPAPTPAASSASTVFTQQNGSISVARAPQPNTPFGTAKTEFEDKIISGMEICQHTINKMITLTNSTSFKTSGNFKDLKDLYIHLQYLFTYTSGKFKTLQESLTTGMESLAKQDLNLKDKADDDELEIVEEKQDVIEVMSDDDEPPAPAQEKEKSPVSPVKKPLLKHIQYTKSSTEDTEQEVPAASVTTIKSTESEDLINLAEILENDKKLKKKVVVKVEKLENTKNPVIKQYMNQLQERLEMMSSDGSREGTPENFFEPMIDLIEGDIEKEKSLEPVVAVTENREESTEKEEESTEKEEESEKLEATSKDVIEVPSDDDDVVETTITEIAADQQPKESEAIDVEPTTEVVEVNGSDEKETEVEKTEVKETEVEKTEVKETEVEKTEVEETEVEKSEESKETLEQEKPEEVDDSVVSEAVNPLTADEAEMAVDVSETELTVDESVISVDDSLTEVEEKSENEVQQQVNVEETTENPLSPSDKQPEIVEEQTPSDDKVVENGFNCQEASNETEIIEPSIAAEKISDDLASVEEEVAKIVSSDIDDEKAMLEDLFNELENKSSAMEVD